MSEGFLEHGSNDVSNEQGYYGELEPLHEVSNDAKQQHQTRAEHAASGRIGAGEAQKDHDREHNRSRHSKGLNEKPEPDTAQAQIHHVCKDQRSEQSIDQRPIFFEHQRTGDNPMDDEGADEQAGSGIPRNPKGQEGNQVGSLSLIHI